MVTWFWQVPREPGDGVDEFLRCPLVCFLRAFYSSVDRTVEQNLSGDKARGKAEEERRVGRHVGPMERFRGLSPSSMLSQL